MRKTLTLLLVAVVGVAFYLYRREAADEQVKAQMLMIAEDMALTPAECDEVKSLISQFHEQAFDKALDLSRQFGRKFDAHLYYEEVLRLVVTRLRSDGRAPLGDKVERQQPYHSLSVTER